MARPLKKTFILYMFRWFLRAVIFFGVLYIYLYDPDIIASFVEFRLFGPFTPLHLLWGFLMLGMITHLLPLRGETMGMRKRQKATHIPPKEPYDRLALLEYVQAMNLKAWRVMLVWLLFNSIIAVIYLLGIIGQAELILLSIFYFFCDITCILMFCPFQTFIMKNRCCVNCRIFDWGHFMMYTPLLFIPSFFTWSLFFTSCIVLLHWEVGYARHPERYWEGSNTALRCANCQDKMCRIKKPLRAVYDKNESGVV